MSEPFKIQNNFNIEDNSNSINNIKMSEDNINKESSKKTVK